MVHPIRHAVFGFSLSLLAGSLAAANFTVTTTADSGAGSLRQALIDASAAGGGTVVFNIPGAGVKTIRPLTGLSASNTVVDPAVSSTRGILRVRSAVPLWRPARRGLSSQSEPAPFRPTPEPFPQTSRSLRRAPPAS